MPFDLSSAKPVQSTGGGFDLASAKPVDAQSASPEPGTASVATPKRLGGLGSAIVEPVLNMATGAIAKPSSDIAGLLAIPGHAMGLTQREPAQVQQEVRQGMTYQPRTQIGQAATEYNPLALIGKGIGAVGDWAGKNISQNAPPSSFQGMAGNLVREDINQLPGLLGIRGGKALKEGELGKQTALDIAKGENLPRDIIRDQSQAAGLITPPEGSSWLAGIPGMAKTNKWISAGNEPKFNRLISDNFNLKKGVAITPEELERIRDEKAGAYRAVIAAGNEIKRPISAPSTILSQTGTPMQSFSLKSGFVADDSFKRSINQIKEEISAKQMEFPETFRASDSSLKLLGDYIGKDSFTPAGTLRAIRQLRKDANTQFKSDDPAKLANAFTSKEIANQLENLIERNLEKNGQTDLLAHYKSARTAIAQTYDVEAALDNTGNVNPRKLYLISQKKPLSGNLKLVADYAGAYPEGAQKVASGKQSISPFDWMFGAGSLAAGHPGVAAAEIAGRAGIPYLAQKGLLQKKTPDYVFSSRTGKILPPAGIGISQNIQPPTGQQQ